MINKYCFCCADCFKSLAIKTNTTTAKLWMELCAEYIDKLHPFEMEPIYDDSIGDLEKLGFIMTVDTKSGNLVKVKGLGFDFTEQISFCLEREKHDCI